MTPSVIFPFSQNARQLSYESYDAASLLPFPSKFIGQRSLHLITKADLCKYRDMSGREKMRQLLGIKR
jgi:hypothetical protein